MKGLLTIMPDGSYEVKSFATDAEGIRLGLSGLPGACNVAAQPASGGACADRIVCGCSGVAEPYSDLSMFQKIGVAGPPRTPVSDLRQALGALYCPSGR